MLTIDWKPDRNLSVQLHKQIVSFIKDKIASGEWQIGTKLPSQRMLSEVFEVNRSTVITAIEELIAEGILKGNAGGGTKVINNTWPLMSARPLTNWNTYISEGTHQANQKMMQLINQADFEPDMIRLGACEPAAELMPDAAIRKALKKLSASRFSLSYEDPKGFTELRKELCAYLKTIGIETNPSSVLITSGALQGLQLISLGLLRANSVVYLEKPSYLYSLRTFQSFGMQLAGISLDVEGMNVEELLTRNKQKKGSMVFTIPTFHNPTGNVMTAERRRTLIQACESEQLPVIEDDVYREVWFEDKPPLPIKAFDKTGLVLYIGSMSKNLSPGLRIGWVVGPEQVINRLADIKMQTDYGSSSLSQYLGAELLASGQYELHNKNLRKKAKLRRDTALKALHKHFRNIASWNVPTGGYFIWLKLNKGISMYELFIKALKRKILIYPGDLYEFHSNRYIRISYSYASLEEIEYSIKILAELIAEQSWEKSR